MAINTTIYNRFRGVDFSTDPSLVDASRSPLCTNIVADSGGMPEKRCGWETLHTLQGQVNGLFSGVWGGVQKTLAHVGTTLYLFTDDASEAPVALLTGIRNEKSRGAYMAGKLWIVTGGEYISCDGDTAVRVRSGECYVPTILISREPGGGGTALENVNLLTPKRKESFRTDGSATVFKLSGSIDGGTTPRVWVWGEESTAFTFAGDTVTMNTAPAAPAVGGEDGLVVEYSHTVAGYGDIIDKCRIITAFGLGGDNRLVLSGNPDYPNRDYMSAYNQPTYFPDLGYSVLGSEATEIMGYARVGSYQAIVKSDNGLESTVFLRSGEIGENGAAVFTTKPAMSGVGAVAAGSFASLLDDPLFLSGTGVQAISVSDMTGSRVTQNRSYFLNARLTQESLTEGEAVAWKGLYLLGFPNGHVYALDGRQEKSYRSAANADFIYEGYYWENVPARCWLKVETAGDELLYFGTADGRLCRFRTVEGRSRYADDGEPIAAVWSTKYDDDGTPSYFKSLLKKGCCVTLKPMARSSGTVYFRTDRSGGTELPVAQGGMDIFSWDDIDFERFTFESDDSPREIYFQKKIKNYKRLQIIIRNAQLNEGFGIYQITKHFVFGNFSKPGKSQTAVSTGTAEDDGAVSGEMKSIFEGVFGEGTWIEE